MWRAAWKRSTSTLCTSLGDVRTSAAEGSDHRGGHVSRSWLGFVSRLQLSAQYLVQGTGLLQRSDVCISTPPKGADRPRNEHDYFQATTHTSRRRRPAFAVCGAEQRPHAGLNQGRAHAIGAEVEGEIRTRCANVGVEKVLESGNCSLELRLVCRKLSPLAVDQPVVSDSSCGAFAVGHSEGRGQGSGTRLVRSLGNQVSHTELVKPLLKLRYFVRRGGQTGVLVAQRLVRCAVTILALLQVFELAAEELDLRVPTTRRATRPISVHRRYLVDEYSHAPSSLLLPLAARMPRFYCEYCEIFLTHSSVGGRRQHNSGRKHIMNVIDYYAKFQLQLREAAGAPPPSLPPNPGAANHVRGRTRVGALSPFLPHDPPLQACLGSALEGTLTRAAAQCSLGRHRRPWPNRCPRTAGPAPRCRVPQGHSP